MEILKIASSKNKQVIDATDRVQAAVAGRGFRNGLCHLFLRHSSAALTTADLDPGTDLDMLDAFEAIMPKLAYRHEHDPSHVPDHIWSAVIGASITVPVADGKLLLGGWQRIVFIEFHGPREREIIVSLTAS